MSLTVDYCRVFQGLFRIAAGASKLKKLKAALDCSTSQLEEFYSDPHAVAGTSQNLVSSYGTGAISLRFLIKISVNVVSGALKSYLRELPEPLMTYQLYDEWIQASRHGLYHYYRESSEGINNSVIWTNYMLLFHHFQCVRPRQEAPGALGCV